jgi:hypothetical protein
LDGGEIAGRNIKSSMIISDKQVKDYVAQLASHSFNDLIGDWGNSGIVDCDCVKRL